MNKIRAILALAPLFLIAAGSGQAATAEEAAAATESAQFLQKALQSSMAEVELGEMAQRNAGSTGINALGSRLARDHRRIGKVLELISQDRGVVVPVSLDSTQRSIAAELSGKKGPEFDAAYAERMVASHESLIALFDQAAAGSDPNIAEFARRALPVLREGRRLAEVYQAVTSKHRAPPSQTQTVAQTTG